MHITFLEYIDLVQSVQSYRVTAAIDVICHVKSQEHSGQTPGMRKWVHFLAATIQFPAQKSKGKHGKQPVSRKIYEKKLKSS